MMYRIRIWSSIAAAVCAICADAATATFSPTLRSAHDFAHGSMGFVSTPATFVSGRSHTSLSLYPKPSAQPAATSMTMTRTNLVTFGDVWRETCEEEALCAQVWEKEGDVEEGVDGVNPITACGTFVSSVATGVWDHLTADPSPEEVQASLAAFAKAHGGAVMTPMSESELEKELRFAGIFPEMVETMIESELTQEDAEKE